jgi:choline dehydrogenase-like flavoprotein
MKTEYDVIVIGAGGDGPALAWRLGVAGVDVLVLEAGPWHGNEHWPDPHGGPGKSASGSSTSPLSGALLDDQFTDHEHDMKDPTSGKLRWGPADRERAPWTRTIPQNGFVWQVAGVGGTTLIYLGNHPRAFPESVNSSAWPIEYEELVPYYQELEDLHPIRPAPTTPKEALFYHGCDEAGWDLHDHKNVTSPGYRPMPNAILQPDEALGGDYDGDFSYPDIEGSTLAGQELHGDPHPRDAPVEERAKRSTLVGFVPRALETGNVTIRPNSFVTQIVTDSRGRTATGVEFRDTWSGSTATIDSDAVVMAAGAIETPRLWLNSDLPENEWVGRGLTTHWFDWVVGVFDEATLEDAIGTDAVRPYVGQNGAARFDYPGLGAIAVNAMPPGITAASIYGISQAGYSFDNEVPDDAPWDTRGRLAGPELKERMADYERTLTLIIHTDDDPRTENGVRLDPVMRDEHGRLPLVEWEPSPEDDEKRDRLAEIAAKILRSAGASHVHRTDQAPVMLHMQSTMSMGKVTDAACEARDVDRLFIGDHSAIPNGLGGANPTHTGQALAIRTADKLIERYFPEADRSDG